MAINDLFIKLVRNMPQRLSFDDVLLMHIAAYLAEISDTIERAAAQHLRGPFGPENPEIGATIMQTADELAASYWNFNGAPQTTQAKNYWLENLQWIGQHLELYRIKLFWCNTHGESSITSLSNPTETMALFGRAVYLRGVAADMLDEDPDRTIELNQVNALLGAIHAWLDETEGQSWDWSGRTNGLICDGIRI